MRCHPDLSAEQVVGVFQHYLAGDERWQSDLSWVGWDRSNAGGISAKLIFVALMVALLGFIAWIFIKPS